MHDALQRPAGGSRNPLYDLLLRAVLRRAGPQHRRAFCRVLGVIFRRYLLGTSGAMDDEYRNEIRTRASEMLPPDMQSAASKP